MAMTFKTNLRPDTDASRELGTSTAGWKITKLNAPTSSGGSTYGAGSAGQALVSNGTTVYWGDVTPPFSTAAPSDLGTATAGTSTAVAHADHVHNMPSAADVGALPDNTFIPSKTSDLTNDTNFMSGMTILTYNVSTWDDFLTAYNANHLVYCRSAATGSPRMAFMAYISYSNNTISNVEFQYYRSRAYNNYTTAIQGDQVCVYKLEAPTSSYPNGKWTLTTRNAYVSIQAGTGLSATTSTATIDGATTTKLVLNAAEVSTATTATTGIVLLSNTTATAVDSTATIGTSTAVARADHTHQGVTSINGKDGAVTLGTLTICGHTYNGSATVTINPNDLGLTTSMEFKGITLENLSSGSTCASLQMQDGSTLVPSNGNVVLDSDNEEYIWSNNQWTSMGMATSYALKTHIHGHIANNGTISTALSSVAGASLILADTTNAIIGSPITFGSSGSNTYLQNNGAWGGVVSSTTTGLLDNTNFNALTSAINSYIEAGSGISISTSSTFGSTSGARTITNAGVRSIGTSGDTLWVDTNGSSTGITVPYATTATYDSSGNTIASTYVLKSGDTMTGNLQITGAADRQVGIENTNIGCKIILAVNTYGNHGLYSLGYHDGTSFTSSSKWIIYRGDDGEAHTQLKLYGAVWNDYAEYRKDNPEESELQKPGRCVHELGNGQLTLTTERLQRGCEIISDTYGFAIGRDMSNGYNTPIASNGRVLAYILEGREEAKKHIGYPVCSGPNGTVSIMTHLEEVEYPSCIIGTISEIPDYEEWGTGKVKVNNRIWIRIR